MTSYGQTKVELTKTDNGYVLEWRRNKEDCTNYQWAATMIIYDKEKTDGMEVFTKLKDAMKRAEEILR